MSSATFPARLAEALEQVGGMKGVASAAGLDRSTIYNLRNGRGSPSIETVERLAEALGVNPRWLAYGLSKPDLAADSDGTDKNRHGRFK